MNKGKAIVKRLGSEGVVGYETAGEWDFIYGTSTIKDPNYDIGDRVQLADGRVYRYSKSNNILSAGLAAEGHIQMSHGIDWTTLGAANVIGDREITFAAATHPAFATNELKGGHLLVSDSDLPGFANMKVMNRGIIGNDASAEDAACTIYLDGPLTRDVDTSTYAFCMPSEYSDVIKANKKGGSCIGLPAAYVDAPNKYFWLQTWGTAWIAMSGNLGKTDSKRAFAFTNTGLIVEYDNSVSDASNQYGGYIIDNNYTANGATFVMLQLVP